MLKAVDVLREIAKEAVSLSKAIEKVVKFGGLGLRSTNSYIGNHGVKCQLGRLQANLGDFQARTTPTKSMTG
jgi:hypothetical protein